MRIFSFLYHRENLNISSKNLFLITKHFLPFLFWLLLISPKMLVYILSLQSFILLSFDIFDRYLYFQNTLFTYTSYLIKSPKYYLIFDRFHKSKAEYLNFFCIPMLTSDSWIWVIQFWYMPLIFHDTTLSMQNHR